MFKRPQESSGPGGERVGPWHMTKTGRRWSVWRHVEGGEGVTVFLDDEECWKWVYEGEFSEAYASMQDAMDAAEEELELE